MNIVDTVVYYSYSLGDKNSKIRYSQLKKSYTSLRKHNPKIPVLIFSTVALPGFDIIPYKFKDIPEEHRDNVSHKHYHYETLKRFQRVLYLDCDTIINGDLQDLFNGCVNSNTVYYGEDKDGGLNSGVLYFDIKVLQRFHTNIEFYFQQMKQNLPTFKFLSEQVSYSNTLDHILARKKLFPKHLIGVGGNECFRKKQLIQHYFTSNTHKFI